MGGSLGLEAASFAQRAGWASSAGLQLSLALFALACSDGDDAGPKPWWTATPATDSAGASNTYSGPSRLMPGTWAIVAAEMDATVVELDQDGNGDGCQAGWAEPPAVDGYASNFCGPVTGHVDGNHVVFDLALPGAGTPLHYSIDGTLAQQGVRIGGTHGIVQGDPAAQSHLELSEPGAAIHYDRRSDPGPFPVGDPWPAYALAIWRGVVVKTDATQGPFVPGKQYRIQKSWTALGGDLGEFLGSELSFEEPNPNDLIIHAGPVEKTTADMPVRLAIQYAGARLTQVEVEMPNGKVFLLTPAPADL